MDTGGAGDGTRDTPMPTAMEMAMEMGKAVTPIAADTASTATPEPMERNENGKWRMRCETLPAAVGRGDWRSRMGRPAQQQACELAQPH